MEELRSIVIEALDACITHDGNGIDIINAVIAILKVGGNDDIGLLIGDLRNLRSEIKEIMEVREAW